MNVSELFMGEYARLYSVSCVAIIVVIMFVMSLRLFLSRRRKPYVSLTLSLAVLIIQHTFATALAMDFGATAEWLDFAAQTLKVLAFIWINTAVYKLYNAASGRLSFYFYVSLIVLFLLAAVRLQVHDWFAGVPRLAEQLGQLGLDLYLLFVALICFVFIPPRIGQARKYRFSVAIYLIAETARLLNGYVWEQPLPAFTIAELYLPIVYYFCLFLLLFERIVELLQSIYRSAIADGLTGLYNRRYFLNRIAQYIRLGYPVSVLFADIDNFKTLNDIRGHQAGDEALKQVAQILWEECEEAGALPGRYGGEELAALLVGSSVPPGEFAERIRRRVEAETNVTVSIGYCRSRKGMSAEQLVKKADQAMYAAKKAGKNRVMPFSPLSSSASAP